MDLEKRVKPLWTLVVIAATLLGAGAASVVYLSRYALASELTHHAEKSDARASALESRAGAVESRTSAIEALQRNIEADYHWQREQVQRIADRVGAARVPVPRHGLADDGVR